MRPWRRRTAGGRYVAAHAHGTAGINAALRAGVRTIDHGSMLDDESIRLLKSRHAYFVPTLLVGELIVGKGESLGVPKSEIERGRQLGDRPGQSLAKALKADLLIGFGTYAGVFPHGLNAMERVKFVMKGGVIHKNDLRSGGRAE